MGEGGSERKIRKWGVSLKNMQGGCIIFKPRGIWLILPVCWSAVVASQASEDSLPLIQFSIKPRLCVLSEGEEVCRDELEIKWRSRTERSLCLHRNDQEEALKCWQRSTSGAHQIEISASQNVDFQLIAMDDKNLLVTEAFEVVHDNTKYRRRRRNAWSFF